MYVFTSRVFVRDHLVTTSRIVVRVYLENNGEDGPERKIESHQKLLSHREARVMITE